MTKLKCQMNPEDFLSQVANHKVDEGSDLVQTLPKAERMHSKENGLTFSLNNSLWIR